MGSPRFVCHRCREKWKTSRHGTTECPKCGHTNVGPTDAAPGGLGKLIVLALIGGVAAAWYLDLLPGEAKQKLDEAKDALQTTVQEVRQEVGADRKAGPAKRTQTEQPEPPKEPTRPAAEPEPQPAAKPKPTEPPAEPKVVVTSKSGAAIGSSYMVKGKVKNEGGVKAANVKVTVTFLDGAGGVVSKVEARCKERVLDPGQIAKYEAAVAGERASDVERFEVEADFEAP